MIDNSNSNVERVSVHHVGNKTNDERLYLSRDLLDISDLEVRAQLSRFFLTPFTQPEFYNFTFTNEDFTLNPLYNFVSHIFEDERTLQDHSKSIAKHLYELAVHPQIKSGDLFVAYISAMTLEGEPMDAIGIFKSENRQSFLKLDNNENDFTVQSYDGINVEKLDKGCLIFNTEKEKGFRICIVDKSNRSAEAQYWKDTFLQLRPCSDDYHHTKEFMTMTKDFVTQQLTEEYEVSKTDQIDMLNRSVEYFKSHENFDKTEFVEEIFHTPEVIESFKNFDEDYSEKNDVSIAESFDISSVAVKKQARVFKSVLKLDKNFHIYIHGNRDLIEKGVDDNGKKYYKIYYNDES